MKRFLYILMILIYVIFAVPSVQAFEQNDLVLVVYNEDDNEEAINLGDLSTIDMTASTVTLAEAGTLDLSYFSEGMEWSDLRAGIYAGNKTTYTICFALTIDESTAISTSKYTSAQNAINSTYIQFGFKEVADGVATGTSSGTSSYDYLMNSNSTTPGYYGGYNNTDTKYGEADLSGLLTDGYVDMYIFKYVANKIDMDDDGDASTEYVGIVRIYVDGSIVLNPVVDHAPTVASTISDVTVNEDAGSTSIDLSGVFTDKDGDAITETAASSKTSLVTVTVSGNTLTLNYLANQNGTAVITVTGTSNGKSVSTTFNVTVNAVDDAPTVASTIADVTVNEDAQDYTIDLSGVFTDIDSTVSAITKTVQSNSNTTLVSATISDNTLTLDFLADQNGTSTVVIRGTSNGLTVDDTFNVTVNSLNDAPTIAGTPETLILSGETYAFTPTSGDVDGDSLTFSIQNQPSWASFNTGTGELSGTPTDSDAGVYSGIIISVTDGNATASLNSFGITVKSTNNTPVITGTPATSVYEDSEYSFTATASDGDGDDLTFTIVNQPSWLTYTTTATTFTLAGTPGASDIGTTTGIVISVSDGLATASLDAFSIEVIHVNHAPVIADIPGQTINLGDSFDTFDLDDYVADSDNADSELTWGYSGNSVLTVSIDSGHVVTIGSSDSTWYGTEEIAFAVEDPDGASDSATVTYTIQLPLPTAPSVNSPADGSEVTDNPPVLSVNNATSAAGLTLTYDFELDDDEIFSDPIAGIYDLEEGISITSWTITDEYPELSLTENTTYYWRARAYDIAESEWMDTATFFFNEYNEAPSEPELSSPSKNATVDILIPTLEVTNSEDPDMDDITYEFEVYDVEFTDNDNPGVSAIDSGAVSEESDGTTSWTVESSLSDNTAYWWRARAVDEHDLASGWIGPYKFVVSTSKTAPTKPELYSPASGAEVGSLTPTLTVYNSIDENYGAVVTYTFQIDTANTFNSTDSGPMEEDEVSEGTGDTTSWQAPPLTEDVTYYWRVKANDGALESSWMTSYFTVNTTNDAPEKPTLRYPEDGATIGTTGPTLKAYSVEDPDGDDVSYVFELCRSGECTESDALESPEWKLSGLKSNYKYQWSVKAVDDSGKESESDTWSFTVVTNSTPTPPRLNNPVSGGSIYSADLVILSVKNSTDEDDDELTYYFEVYGGDEGEADFDNLIEAGSSEEGNLITEYEVETDLTEGETYYWRAQAYDGENYSSYTSTFSFVYSAEEPEYTVDVVESEVVYASLIAALGDDETYDITVDDEDSGIKGVTISIPKGAITTNLNITIGIATATPSLPSGVAVTGTVLDFGPEGTEFETYVTIKIPYTQEYLTSLGLDDPNDLKLYTYSSLTEEWEILEPSAVDADDLMVEYQTKHFSIYTFGISTTGDSDSGDSDDGGLGVCFISTAANNSNMTPVAGIARLSFNKGIQRTVILCIFSLFIALSALIFIGRHWNVSLKKYGIITKTRNWESTKRTEIIHQ